MTQAKDSMKVVANLQVNGPLAGTTEYRLEHLGVKIVVLVSRSGDVNITGHCKQSELEALIEGIVENERLNAKGVPAQ